jgi:hypothetical protein
LSNVLAYNLGNELDTPRKPYLEIHRNNKHETFIARKENQNQLFFGRGQSHNSLANGKKLPYNEDECSKDNFESENHRIGLGVNRIYDEGYRGG